MNGHLSTSSCDPSAEYGKSAAPLEFLQSLRKPAAGARVFGRVGFAWSAFDDGSVRTGVPNTMVTLTGNGQRRSVEPRDGEYDFSALRPGTYTLHVAPVPMMTGDFTRQVSLQDARACAQVDAYFQHDTAIAGQLVAPKGAPVENVRVQLAPLRTWRREVTRTISALSDQAGHFEFRAVAPGDYVIGLNIADNVAHDPYPRSMYVDAAGEPEIIRIAPGQHVGLSPWTIGAPLVKVRVRIRLFDADGRPLSNQRVSLFDITNPGIPDSIQHVMGARTAADGSVVFDARVSRSYIVARNHRLVPGVTRTSVFTPDEGTTQLTLVLR